MTHLTAEAHTNAPHTPNALLTDLLLCSDPSIHR